MLDDGDGERIVLQERRRKEERHMWVTMMGWIGSGGRMSRGINGWAVAWRGRDAWIAIFWVVGMTGRTPDDG